MGNLLLCFLEVVFLVVKKSKREIERGCISLQCPLSDLEQNYVFLVQLSSVIYSLLENSHIQASINLNDFAFIFIYSAEKECKNEEMFPILSRRGGAKKGCI